MKVKSFWDAIGLAFILIGASLMALMLYALVQ
jgi:hypothetical protein